MRAKVVVALGVAGAVLGLLGLRVLVVEHDQTVAEAVAQVVVSWTFIAAGLFACWRRPESRVGVLIAAAGFALLARRFQYAESSAVFTTGFALGELWNVLIAHAVLAYPSGRLETRVDRLVVALGYAVVVVFPLATLAVYDPSQSCLYNCASADPPRSLLLVGGDAHLFDLTRDGFRIVLYAVLGTTFIALILRKFVTATPARRWARMPLLVAGFAAAIRAVSEGGLTFTTYSERTRQVLFWWQIVVIAAVPIALVVGLLRERLARATVADLLPELESASPAGVRDALARVLRDPSLEIAFWLPERGVYVDPAGRFVALPQESEGQAVTRLEHDGEPIAALLHDPALREEHGLVEAVAAAARLALENARLHAELRAQLDAVSESRARIVAAADAERLRIEQNLHDGAQQRLVALALELRAAQRRLGREADPDVDRVLTGAVDELQRAVEDLRELAHGVHPSILRQEGLTAALEALAHRAPLPVTVLSTVEDRLGPETEAAAYFVACEALANAVKHARASAATITATRDDGRLVVEVLDDGAGGANVNRGSGLRGLCDRVEAQGGTLRIVSPPGGGTRIVGVIPCAS
jgi:signal transduction histidine kinase